MNRRRLTVAGLGVLFVMGVSLALAQTQKAPPGLPPAAEAAVLDGDPSQPHLYVVRLRMPDGYRIKPHWHNKDEHVTVISGRFAMGMGDRWNESQMKEVGPGGYFSMPAVQRHFAMSRGETVVQLSNIGPFEITYVNPSDDPRSQRSSR